MIRNIYQNGIKTPEHTYIYKLICPETNETRYIGKADNLDDRLAKHIQDAVGVYSSTRKDKWIRSLLDRGLKPEIETIEQCRFEDYISREKYWIRYHLKQGCELFNQRGRRVRVEVNVGIVERDAIKAAAARYDIGPVKAIRLLVEYAANHLNLDTVYQELAQKHQKYIEW